MVQARTGLNFLAMDVYIHQRYKVAVNYWRQLLNVTPKGSADANAIIEAIETAQRKGG